jgi:hypothetical protein
VYYRALLLILYLVVDFQQAVLAAGFAGQMLQLSEFLAGGVDVDDGRTKYLQTAKDSEQRQIKFRKALEKLGK